MNLVDPRSDVNQAYLSFALSPGVHEVKRTFKPGSNGFSLAIIGASTEGLAEVLRKISCNHEYLI